MNDIRVCGGSRVDLSNTFVCLWISFASRAAMLSPSVLPPASELYAGNSADADDSIGALLGSAKSRLLIICAEKTAGAIVLDFPSCFLRVAGRRVPIVDLELCALVGIRKLYETRSISLCACIPCRLFFLVERKILLYFHLLR